MSIDVASVDMPKGHLYIGGEWRKGTGAEIPEGPRWDAASPARPPRN